MVTMMMMRRGRRTVMMMMMVMIMTTTMTVTCTFGILVRYAMKEYSEVEVTLHHLRQT
jgi:hypothetical protein